jgi:hypothetical protein
MQQTIRDRWDKRKGSALVFSALMLVGTLGMVGFAVDGGSLFLVRARLSAAADGSALGAARSVSYASTVAQATAQATTVANQFFAANFPAGYLGTGATPTVAPVFAKETGSGGNPDGILRVSLTATVQAPTYFMNLFGYHKVPVTATGTATRRGLVLMLVLDQSNSMNTSPSACAAMRTAANSFITMLSPWDTVGMVTFDSSAHLSYPPSTTFGNGSLAAKISAITCNGNTGTAAALEMAYQQIVLQNLPLAFNNMILFTDGVPNGIAANFPVRRSVDTRWGPAYSAPSQPGGSLWGRSFYCGLNLPDNNPCQNMGVIVTGGTTVRGSLSAAAGQDSYGGYTFPLYQPWDTDPAIAYPPGSGVCWIYSYYDCNSEIYAYIPDIDAWGNSTHGVPATGPGPTVCGAGACNGLVSRDLWLYQTNQLCNNGKCDDTGDLWSNHATVGSVSNYFPLTNPAYPGKLRVDQPNTVAAASMNSAMAEAYKIRSNATLNIGIHTVFLTGNNSDAVDREFLPIIANSQTIPALPYDPVSYVPYTNPAFQASQQQGLYLVTSDLTQLTALFSQLASQLLRISQ